MVSGAQLDESAQVFASGKVEDAFFFLVMDPEDISRDDIDAAHFHLEYLIFPAALVTSGKVEFTAYAEKRPVIHFHIVVSEGQGAAVRGGAAEMTVERDEGFLFEISEVQFMFHGVFSFLVPA